VPGPPAFLSPRAQAEWRRIAPILFRAGLLSRLDYRGLAAYCSSFARWCDAEDEIRKSGTVIRGTHNVPMMSPFVKVSKMAFEQWTRMLSEFGMGPASRTRVASFKPAPKDPLERFLSGEDEDEADGDAGPRKFDA